MTELREQSAWVLGAGAILVAFAIYWFAGILLSFRHAPGLSGRGRVLQFFEPGTMSWALAILLAVALITIARKFESARALNARMHEVVPAGLFLAAVSVTVSALVGVLVELTNFGNGIDAAFASLISYVAVLLVGAAASWWAYIETRAHYEERKLSRRTSPGSERPTP